MIDEFHDELLQQATELVHKEPDAPKQASLRRGISAASSRILNSNIFPFVGEDPAVVENLRFVADAFVQLQNIRHVADYDNTVFWTRTQALGQLKLG